MVTVALAGSLFFSISPTAARGKVALSLVLTMLPFGVVAPFLGPAIDRSKGGRRLMLIGAAAGRALAAVVMAREIHSLLLFPAALGLLILSKTHAVTKSSLVPSAVHSVTDLVKANGKLAMLAAVISLLAAGPAVAILKILGAAWVLRVAGVIYLAGAAAGLRLRPIAPAELPQPGPEAEQAVLHRGVTLAATTMAVLRAAVGFLTFAVAFDFRRQHAPSWWFGIVLASSLGGSFVGAAIGSRIRRRLSEERILTAGLWLVALSGVVAGRIGSRPGFALLGFTVGVSAGVGRLAFDAIVQRDADEAGRGRSFARFEATFQLCWVGAALLPVLVPIPARPSSFVLALGAGMTGAFYVTGRRSLRRARRRPSPSIRPPDIHGVGSVRWLDDDAGGW